MQFIQVTTSDSFDGLVSMTLKILRKVVDKRKIQTTLIPISSIKMIVPINAEFNKSSIIFLDGSTLDVHESPEEIYISSIGQSPVS